MAGYLFKRLVLSSAILVTAIISLFCLIYVVPGDPATIALGPRASAEQKAAFREKMGLDQPMAVQAIRFVGQLAQADLGTDILTQRPVADLVGSALPRTVVLAVAGLGWAILLGIPLGVWSALKPDSWTDRLIGIFSTSVIALPSFVVAIYALVVFAVVLKWLPAIGAGEPGDYGDQARRLILPAFAVGVGWVGYIARLVRAAMLDTLQENHIRTYRAFGISDLRIALRYALPIAIVPVIAVLGVGMGSLLSGAVLVEVVFARPGLGSLAQDAVMSRNFPVLLGTVVVTTALYVVANLIADMAAAFLDPRIRQES
jgi:peptide/nickel transport system permease protein